MDWVDGKWVPPRVVVGQEELLGTHQRSVHVEAGGQLVLVGILQGTLHVEEGATVVIRGACQGTLHVSSGSLVIIEGRQEGTVHVDQGGRVEAKSRAKLAGTIHNDGLILNQGVRGGRVSGEGTLKDLPGSSVKQPVMRDGAWIYHW